MTTNSKTWTPEEIRVWVESQDWYQTIPITEDISTPGSTNSPARLDDLDLPDLTGTSVLDVGSNSGMYCFECKRRGARHVVGIEPKEHRLQQAKTLAEILDLEVQFRQLDLFEAHSLGTFDIVLCFAVLTEVTDVVRGLQILSGLTRESLYLELELFGRRPGDVRIPFRWLGDRALRTVTATDTARLRRTKTGWSIAPSLDFVDRLLGDEFYIHDLGPSLRYRLLKLTRRKTPRNSQMRVTDERPRRP